MIVTRYRIQTRDLATVGHGGTLTVSAEVRRPVSIW